jgi:phosphomannomutase
MLLKALEEENKSLSEFIAETARYKTLRENITCKNEIKHRIVEKAEKRLKTVFPAYEQCSSTDGVRLALEDGWVIVRALGTEPVIRLTVEGESLKVAKEIMEKGVALIKKLIREMK